MFSTLMDEDFECHERQNQDDQTLDDRLRVGFAMMSSEEWYEGDDECLEDAG